MTARTLTDGTPIPPRLEVAHAEAGALVYEASRVGVALRDLSAALSDADEPTPARYRAGLCEAVGLIGDYVEGWALSRRTMLEGMAREEHAAPEPSTQAPHRTAEEVTP